MTSPYLKRLLGEREEVILISRPHWLQIAYHILPEVLVMIAVIVLITLAWAVWLVDGLVALAYLLVILPLISLLRDVLIWANHQYIVTSHRVIQVIGVFNKNVTDSSLEKVNDVKMVQSFLGRVFGYGDIEILTASEMGINRFPRISNPIRFKTAMLNAKQKLDEGVKPAVERPPAAPPAAQAAAAPVEDIPALIARLGELHEKGTLTDEEFEKKKAELLARL